MTIILSNQQINKPLYRVWVSLLLFMFSLLLNTQAQETPNISVDKTTVEELNTEPTKVYRTKGHKTAFAPKAEPITQNSTSSKNNSATINSEPEKTNLPALELPSSNEQSNSELPNEYLKYKGHKSKSTPIIQQKSTINNEVLSKEGVNASIAPIKSVENNFVFNNKNKVTSQNIDTDELQLQYFDLLGHKYLSDNFRIKKHAELNIENRITLAKTKEERKNLRNRLLAQQYIVTLGHKYLNKNITNSIFDDAQLDDKPPIIVKGKNLSTPISDKSTTAPPTLTPKSKIDNSGFESIADGEELLLILQLDNLVLDAIFGFKEGRGAYIGLESLFSVLDLPINVNIEEQKASGWFIHEDNTFNLSTAENAGNTIVTVTVADKPYIVPNNLVRFEDDDIYVYSSEVFKWLDFKFNINFFDLILTIKPSVKLPLQQRLAREARLGKSNISQIKEPVLPRRITPYKAFTFPFIDASASSIYTDTLDTPTTNFSLLAKGDLAYFTGTYFLSGNDSEGISNTSIRLEKESLTNDLLGPLKLSKIELGDITPVRLPFSGTNSQELGFRVTNTPLTKPSSFNTTSLSGESLPDYDAELYHNNVLIETIRIGNDGRYEFNDIDLYFGKNDFKIIFYGPQGQVQERFESVPVNTNSILENNLYFNASVTRQEYIDSNNNEERNALRFSSVIEKGINSSISLQSGLESLEFDDGIRHNFIPLGINVFTNLAKINIGYIKDLDGGSLLDTSIKSSIGQHSINYNFLNYSEDYQDEFNQSNNIKNSNNIAFSGPLFQIDKLRTNYSLSTTKTKQFDGSEGLFIDAFLGVFIPTFSLSNTLNYIDLKSDDGNIFTINNGTFQLTKNFNSVRLRSQINYTLEPDTKITNTSVSALWPITNNIVSEVAISDNDNATTGRWNLTWDTSFASFTSQLSYNTEDQYNVGLNMRFSLGRDPKSKSIKLSRNRISNTGGISARVFEDVNLDGIYNEGEPLIEGAKISGVNVKKHTKSDISGIAFLTGLPRNRATDIELELESLEDPFWIPLNEGFSFTPRPGQVETLDIPIVTSGEIDGNVYLKTQGKERALNYAPLELINEQGVTVFKTGAEFDGFYLFANISPGHYTLKASSSYLKNRELVQVSNNLIVIEGDGTVISGENIVLQPAAEAIINDDKNVVTLTDHFTVNLGNYMSKNHANIMWLMLRKQYPLILPYKRYTSLRDKQYHLALVVPNNEIKAIINWCNTIKSMNKVCTIEK